MKIVANQAAVAQMREAFSLISSSEDGWTRDFLDPATGHRWQQMYLAAHYHGGGMPIFVKAPPPDTDELLRLAATSPNAAEVAASAWLLADRDKQGNYKERLLSVAEEATSQGDHGRAALLIGWGSLDDETISVLPSESTFQRSRRITSTS